MFVHYQSEYANQVQQLIVSVSKHFQVKKNGHLTYQKKPIEVDLLKLSKSNRNHLVHFLIRDHYSGVFYGEVSPSIGLLSLGEFLYRAWSEKEDYVFLWDT
jgi:hypothetical protein